MQDTGISQNYGWITLNEAETGVRKSDPFLF